MHHGCIVTAPVDGELQQLVLLSCFTSVPHMIRKVRIKLHTT
jgi:hypothetical protein